MPETIAIPDAAERRQALDITASYIVEAPAGSGKTGLLIQRYLKLLASQNVTDPGQVLAITFTRKATAELQERVLAQLTAARDAIPPANAFDAQTRPFAEAVLARDAQLDWRLIESPRCLRIRTIDSVATEIARSLPILSGSGGSLTPADDAGALHAAAAHRTLMLLGGADAQLSHALQTLLLHRDGSLTDCEALLTRMLAARDQWGEHVPLSAAALTDQALDETVLPRLEKALDQAICRALTRLTRVMPAPTLRSLCELAAEMGRLDGYKGNPSPIALCSGRPLPPPEKTAHLDHWSALVDLLLTGENEFRKARGINIKTVAFMIEKPHSQELARILDEIRDNPDLHEALCAIRCLPPATYPPDQWLVTKAVFRVLARALVELQFVFAERGECDFAELGLRARAALRRDAAGDPQNEDQDGTHNETQDDALRSITGISLQHLLVDEMQDTSSAQYELIQLLTRQWDGHSQTVFLVGDPKQSIYLFRQARVERFLRTLTHQKLGDVPLTALYLTANFRSQRALVEAFNHDFAQLFPTPPPPGKTTTPGAPGLDSETWAPTTQIPPRTTTTPGLPGLDSETWAPTTQIPPRTTTTPGLPGLDSETWAPTTPPPPGKTTTPGAPGLDSETWAPTTQPPPGTTTTPGAPGLDSETWEEAPPPSNPTSPEEVPFRRAHPMRPATPSAARVWHAEALPYLPSKTEARTLRLAKSREHANLAAQIALRWRLDPEATIAVLVRNRNHLLDIVKAFQSARIPYRAVKIEPLAERQEILDLLALTRALLHPADRTAWLAILRAPWCGLALADLHTLTGLDDPIHRHTNVLDLLEQRGDLLSPDALARLEPFWSVVQAALAQRGAMPLSTLVARTWHAFAAPLVLSPEALTNAGQFFALLAHLERQPGALSLATLGQRLKELYATPATHPGAVDLMTIHNSKGLEWDVVFVPALEKTGVTDTAALIHWLEIDAGEAANPSLDDTAHGILAPIQARGKSASQLIKWMRSIVSAREAAERKRLFYVACTRAREELHLFTALAETTAGELNPRTDSLLKAAWPAAEPNLHRVPAPAPAILESIAAEFQQASVSHDVPTEASGRPGSIRTIQRIPRDLLPTVTFTPQPEPPPDRPRPEGSFVARAFGNTTHALLDLLASLIAGGQSPRILAAAIPDWTPRIQALLRSGGVAPNHLPRYTATLSRALTRTLEDPHGQWLLAPHPGAGTEATLTGPDGTLRLDRTFLAGPTPGTTGTTHRWIVDYKTAAHAQSNLDDFLAKEKEKYQSQLETYALALAPQGLPIRLALYHPLLDKLTWWTPPPHDDARQNAGPVQKAV